LAPDYAALSGVQARGGQAWLTLNDRHCGTPPVAHGGVLLSLMDAAIASLGAGGVISLQSQLLAPARHGDRAEAKAWIVRQTRSVAFAAAEVRVGERLLATAQAVVMTPDGPA
jgi:acyl-coenzyme A thioesterase PaaI-like protein